MEKINFIEDCFFTGHVTHKRLKPFKHFFKYRVSYFWFDIEKAPRNKFFKFDSFSLYSFYGCDHGEKNRDISQSLFHYYQEKLINLNYKNIKTIKVLCLPRILNYSFNPISVFACFNEKKKCEVFICEVSNTFKERYAYLFNVKKGIFLTKKEFHVSPFLRIEGDYKIKFTVSKKMVKLIIFYKKEKKQILYADFLGERRDFSNINLLKLFFGDLLQNFKVTLGIYYEALKLFLKGAIYVSKPKKPERFINLNNEKKNYGNRK